ncbi:hypothetical protein [Aeromonas hydrophila]|uniref:hypothetical protein n=1 Tax=Aeromonas hydrophila TaxID=644 RepID=UPI003EC8C6D0
MIDIKKITPGEWIKIATVTCMIIVGGITAYNTIWSTKDEVASHGKQIGWLQSNARNNETRFAVIETKMQTTNENFNALSKKMEVDTERQGVLYEKLYDMLNEVQKSNAVLNATISNLQKQVEQNEKKGR